MEVSVWEKIHNDIQKMSFAERLDICRRAYSLANNGCYGTMKYDGYVAADESCCARYEKHDYYVYMWKHNYGEPFYVGSGAGDRWKTINPRCNEFYKHIDKADAVVYKVVSGLDERTARLCERYISANLANAGYSIANHDFNRDRISTDFSDDVREAAEKAVYDILAKNRPSDCRTTMAFLQEYGDNYFSEKYRK